MKMKERQLNDVFGGVESRLNTIVEHSDGKVFDLYAHNVVTRDFVVSSPEYSRNLTYLDGGFGAIESDVVLEPRNITIHFWMRAEDVLGDYVSMRDFVFKVFGSGSPIYVSDTREPSKRWLAVLGSTFEMEQTGQYGFFEVPLIALKGVSESSNIVTRKIITETFDFYNSGDIPIKMVNQEETTLEFRGVSNDLTITNKGNDDVWKYEGSTQESDVILLKGVRSLKNGIPIFRDANKQILAFEPGRNALEFTGITGDFEVLIKTRWYFI